MQALTITQKGKSNYDSTLVHQNQSLDLPVPLLHLLMVLRMLHKICNLLSDVCGLVKTVFAVKFVTFIDDATCHNWIYLSYYDDNPM